MTITWDWVPNNAGLLAVTALDHLVLTLVAVGVGLVLSFSLALLIVRDPRSSGPILGIAGILYTIPSLALFALLVPITGLTALTAEIGLVSYTLLILIRNIVAGFDSVAPDIREAADAMGYTPLGRLLRVELPLAVPLIVAGLRIATVTTIGLVMVTALIGEGGLGQLTLRGFNLQNWAEVYSSSIVTVVLAVVADGALVIGGRLATPWSRGL
ncbi:MAG TPA: ABC transporter permease [Candidatus Limnocylindrales bacterium]